MAITLPPLPPLPPLPGGGGNITQATRFKPDFVDWAKSHGYADYDFIKNPNSLPSFGGKASPDEKLTREPVILVHGNTDTAAAWDKAVSAYKKAGYKDSEIYVMSWGDGKMANAGKNYHSEHNLREVRGFIQAVKDYTGANKVDVVGHSMGVTLARKAIKGGTGDDQASVGGHYDLGKPINDEVDTFVGISGANKGLTSCDQWGGNNPTCSDVNGFSTRSKFLADLNADPTKEGDHVYSIYSTSDGILGSGANGASRTGPIPGEEGEKVYSKLNHFQSRDQTGDVQVKMINDHVVPQIVTPSDPDWPTWPTWPSLPGWDLNNWKLPSWSLPSFQLPFSWDLAANPQHCPCENE